VGMESEDINGINLKIDTTDHVIKSNSSSEEEEEEDDKDIELKLNHLRNLSPPISPIFSPISRTQISMNDSSVDSGDSEILTPDNYIIGMNEIKPLQISHHRGRVECFSHWMTPFSPTATPKSSSLTMLSKSMKSTHSLLQTSTAAAGGGTTGDMSYDQNYTNSKSRDYRFKNE
jgi:hypothetical protein